MRYLLLSLCVPLMAQTPDFGRTAQAGAQYDLTAAARTMPIKAGLSSATPSTCTASKELYIKTDAPAGQQLYLCSSAGNGFVLVGDGAGAGAYTLPTATGSVLGGIKIGSGLSIDGGGVVTASGGGSGLGYALTLSGASTQTCGNSLFFGLTPISGIGSSASENDGWKVLVPKSGTITTVTFNLYQSVSVTAPTATGTAAIVLGSSPGTTTVLASTLTWPTQFGNLHTSYTGLSIPVTAGQLIGGKVIASTCTSGSYTSYISMTVYIE